MHKKDRPSGTIYVLESAWLRLRQAAHHWTTTVTLLIGDLVGVIPQAGHFFRCINDA